MAQHLWKAVGWCKPTVRSLFNISRVFSSSRPVNETTLGPVQKNYDKQNADRRLKRSTDPEWALRDQAIRRRADKKYRAKWDEERHQQRLRYRREHQRIKYATDPQFRLNQWVNNLLRKHSWVRERLPWKSYTPVCYEDKVQHTCHTCLIPRRGGAFKLWFASHDGEHYQCSPCYLRGSNMMPEGYEDVSTMAELKKRMDELGH